MAILIPVLVVLTEEAVALMGWTLVHTMVLFEVGASAVSTKERNNKMAPEDE